MSRVMIVSFDSDDSAEQVVRLLDQVQQGKYPVQVGQAFQEMGLILGSGATIEAVVARPTLACTCKSHASGFVKTNRFGWLVHRMKIDGTKCMRPPWRVVQNFISNMVVTAGNDLLPEIRATKEEEIQPDAVVVDVVPPVQAAGSTIAGPTSTDPQDVAPQVLDPAEPQFAIETTQFGAWKLAPDCTIEHKFGEDGWRPGPDEFHEHWVPDTEEPAPSPNPVDSANAAERWLMLYNEQVRKEQGGLPEGH
jgi:hypothetical protein